MTTRALGFSAALALAFAGMSGDAMAYHPVPGFHLEARLGGASRVYFTGSPRWDGADCGSCHVDAPGEVRFELTSTPEDIFATGRYEPGRTYSVSVVSTGAEGKGLRTFMLETLDEDDVDVGTYLNPFGALQPSCTFMCKNTQEYQPTCAPDGDPICSEVARIPGCEYCGASACTVCNAVDGVIGSRLVPQPWIFEFIAPPAGTGPITMYFGGVAGRSDHSSLDDDYQMQVHRLCEGQTACAADPPPGGEEGGDYTPGQSSSAGCSAGSDPDPGRDDAGWMFLFGLAVLALARRRG